MPIYFPPPPPHIGGLAPLTPKYLVQSGVASHDDPPFATSLRALALENILKSWEPPPPLPAITVGPVVQGRVSVNDPPPPRGADLQKLMQSILAWQEPRYTPLWSGVVIQDNTVVHDNPPFGRDLRNLATIIDIWNTPTIPRQTQRLLPQATTVPQDKPPFGIAALRTLATILGWWEPAAASPTLPRNTVQPFVFAQDNPPFGIDRIRTLATILRAWEAPPPLPQQTIPKQIVSVAPPIVSGRRIWKWWYRSST